MHSARLDRSPRLQRLLAALKTRDELTSMELLVEARIVGLSAAVSELRANGAIVDCRQTTRAGGEPVWLYRLVAEPGEAPPAWWRDRPAEEEEDDDDGFRLVAPGEEAPA